MSSQKQKALFLESKHGNFVVGERDIPKPGEGQLLIKIQAVALNPVDYKIQASGEIVEHFPAVLGVDMAGIVEQVGEGVQDFAKGDNVLSHGNFTNDGSGYQQYALAVAHYTAKIPPNLDFDRAATVPLGFGTAAVGLYSDQLGAGLTPPWVEGGRGKYAGKPILIIGGASSVGSYVIQLAQLSGFSPIITTASLVHKDELKAFGATDVIDRHISRDELKAEALTIARKPIGIIYDAISLPETQQAALSALDRGGTLVLTTKPVVEEKEGKGRTVVATYGYPHTEPNKTICRAYFSVLEKWLKDGTIKPEKYEVLPNGLHGVQAGLHRLRDGKISGKKLIAHPQETA